MKHSIPRLTALLMALALGAAACGSSESGDAAAPAAQTESVQAEGAESGVPAATSVLDISAPLADGSTLELSEFAGQDLMLWFWAPW